MALRFAVCLEQIHRLTDLRGFTSECWVQPMVTLIHSPSMEMAANAWLRPCLCPRREVPAKPSHLAQHRQLPAPEPEGDKLLERCNPLVATGSW